MKTPQVAITTRLFRIGAHIGAAKCPRTLSTAPISADRPVKKMIGRIRYANVVTRSLVRRRSSRRRTGWQVITGAASDHQQRRDAQADHGKGQELLGVRLTAVRIRLAPPHQQRDQHAGQDAAEQQLVDLAGQELRAGVRVADAGAERHADQRVADEADDPADQAAGRHDRALPGGALPRAPPAAAPGCSAAAAPGTGSSTEISVAPSGGGVHRRGAACALRYRPPVTRSSQGVRAQASR